jgi:threonine dehydrogenase-like Zn-dependent dehydrogenase
MLTSGRISSGPESRIAGTLLPRPGSGQAQTAEHLVISRLSGRPNLAVRRQPVEDVSPQSIVIRMLAAGVCGTDLAMLSGGRVCGAEILGHEAVGLIVHTPAGSGTPAGARVVINPVHRKHPEVVIGHSRNGVFRQFFCVNRDESEEGHLLVPCPHGCALSAAELVLTEPLASVLYSIELLHSRCGDCSLIVRGSGTIGILAVKLWAMLTGRPAILVSQSETHAHWLSDAVSWPAPVHVCSVGNLAHTIAGYSGNADFRAAVLCCSRESAPAGLKLLLDHLPQHSTIDFMAGFPAEFQEPRLRGLALDRVRWDNSCGAHFAEPTPATDAATSNTVYLTGHRGTGERHILAAIGLLSRRVISLADIPHRIFTLEQLPAAVERMLSTDRVNTKWVKAIVTFSQKDHGQSATQA